MSTQGSERRRYPRHRVHVRVLYFSKGQPRGVDAACDDVGLGGVFIRTRRRGPKVGDSVSLLLTFDDTPGELMLAGVVRRQTVVAFSEGSEHVGLGIEFVDVPPETRDALERAIENAKRED